MSMETDNNRDNALAVCELMASRKLTYIDAIESLYIACVMVMLDASSNIPANKVLELTDEWTQQAKLEFIRKTRQASVTGKYIN